MNRQFDYKYYDKQILDETELPYKVISNIVYLDVSDEYADIPNDLMLIVFTDKTIAAYMSAEDEEWQGPCFSVEPIPIIHKTMADAGLVSRFDQDCEIDRLKKFKKGLAVDIQKINHDFRKKQTLEYLREYGIPEEYEKK